MADEKQKIDPRYDAAFQRGFDGQVRASHSSASVRRSSLVSSYRHPESAPLSAEPGDQHPEVQKPESSIPIESAAELSVATQSTPTHRAAMRELLRNPFLVVLVVLGLALTIGGIGWANQAQLAVGSLATERDYWYLQVSVVGVPATILTGVAMLAGVLFVAAAAWNRR